MRNDKGMGANRLGLKTEAIQLEGKRLSGWGGGASWGRNVLFTSLRPFNFVGKRCILGKQNQDVGSTEKRRW